MYTHIIYKIAFRISNKLLIGCISHSIYHNTDLTKVYMPYVQNGFLHLQQISIVL